MDAETTAFYFQNHLAVMFVESVVGIVVLKPQFGRIFKGSWETNDLAALWLLGYCILEPLYFLGSILSSNSPDLAATFQLLSNPGLSFPGVPAFMLFLSFRSQMMGKSDWNAPEKINLQRKIMLALYFITPIIVLVLCIVDAEIGSAVAFIPYAVGRVSLTFGFMYYAFTASFLNKENTRSPRKLPLILAGLGSFGFLLIGIVPLLMPYCILSWFQLPAIVWSVIVVNETTQKEVKNGAASVKPTPTVEV